MMAGQIDKIIQRIMFPTRKYLNRKFRENEEDAGRKTEELKKDLQRCENELKKCFEQNQKLMAKLMRQSEFEKRIARLEAGILRMTPKTMLNFVVHLSEHCNLNCQGCDHFSPVAEQGFLDIDSFKRDLERLSELLNGRIKRIALMGGEPLLYPDICKAMKIARNNFPVGEIAIVTNGLLLNQMDGQFWETCLREDIVIEITKYPVDFAYDEAVEMAKGKGVEVIYYGDTGIHTKMLGHYPLDIQGRQDITANFYNCAHANRCIQLRDGRLYTCTIIPNVHHFNQYFNKNLIVSEDDSIDIYKVKDKKEIFEFLAHPIPFCRYCDIKGRTHGHEWGRSAPDISEWTIPQEK